MRSAGEEEQSMKIINPSKENRSEWDEFVYNHPKGNIFQSPHLAEVFDRAKGIEPIALAAIDEDSGQILASLLAYVLKYTNILSSFTSRARIRGGPLFLNTEKGILTAEMLLKHYDGVIRRKALYTDVVNMWDVSNSSALALIGDAGYVYEGYLNFLVGLTKSKDELWACLSQARRRGIRKAQKSGVTVKETKDKEDVREFYDILCETYRNIKMPLEDISLFNAIFELLAPKSMAKLFLAEYERKHIGGVLILTYKGIVYAWYGGAYKEYSQSRPFDLLIWYAITWGSENGYKILDFLGAGKPNEKYGVRDFKKQFGGELVNFGYYKKIHSPRKLWLAERGVEVWKRIK